MFEMSQFATVFIVALNIVIVIGRPTEQPTKLEQGKELLGQVTDVIRFSRGRFVNSAAMVKNFITDRAEEVASEAQNNVASVIAAKSDLLADGRNTLESLQKGILGNFLPSRTRETVQLESEREQGILEKQLPNPVGRLFENFLRPTPLVDRIKEEEKYGNSGDKFAGVGKVLVEGIEGLSNFLNGIVDLPLNVAKKTSRSVTETLNQIGARIIGL